MMNINKALELYFEKAESLTTEEELNELRANISNMVSLHDYETFMESTDVNMSVAVTFYQHLAKVIGQSHLIREKASSWLNNSIMNSSITVFVDGYSKNNKKGKAVFNKNYINGFAAGLDRSLINAEKKAIKEIKDSSYGDDVKSTDIQKIRDFFKNLPDYARKPDTFVANYNSIINFIKSSVEHDKYKDDIMEMIDVYFTYDEYKRRLNKRGVKI